MRGSVMPTWGVVVLRFQKRPDSVDINIWRKDLLTEFGPEDFLDPLMEVGEGGSGPIPIDDGSIWVDVGVCCAFYGEGYERGDAEWFVRLAEWLEQNVAGCEVWYGNDCADESIQPFGPPERAALLAYFRRVGHEPYYSYLRQGPRRSDPAGKPSADASSASSGSSVFLSDLCTEYLVAQGIELQREGSGTATKEFDR